MAFSPDKETIAEGRLQGKVRDVEAMLGRGISHE
jgi:hypothetical protein